MLLSQILEQAAILKTTSYLFCDLSLTSEKQNKSLFLAVKTLAEPFFTIPLFYGRFLFVIM